MLNGKEMERRLREILEKTEIKTSESKSREEEQKTARNR